MRYISFPSFILIFKYILITHIQNFIHFYNEFTFIFHFNFKTKIFSKIIINNFKKINVLKNKLYAICKTLLNVYKLLFGEINYFIMILILGNLSLKKIEKV